MPETISLTINGRPETLTADPDMPLMYALRDAFGLTGVKYGCGDGLCGSCSVLLDGARICSCHTALKDVAGRAIETIESLAGDDHLHPLQQAFIDEQALQCGYCTPGFIMAAKALLDQTPDPDDAAIRTALQDNLCRCGSYARILAAVKRAAKEMTQP